jgi:hypothetical protein
MKFWIRNGDTFKEEEDPDSEADDDDTARGETGGAPSTHLGAASLSSSSVPPAPLAAPKAVAETKCPCDFCAIKREEPVKQRKDRAGQKRPASSGTQATLRVFAEASKAIGVQIILHNTTVKQHNADLDQAEEQAQKRWTAPRKPMILQHFLKHDKDLNVMCTACDTFITNRSTRDLISHVWRNSHLKNANGQQHDVQAEQKDRFKADMNNNRVQKQAKLHISVFAAMHPTASVNVMGDACVLTREIVRLLTPSLTSMLAEVSGQGVKTKLFKQQFKQLCALAENRQMLASNMDLMGKDMQHRRLRNAGECHFVTAYMDECTTNNHSHSLTAGSWIDPHTMKFRSQMWDSIRLTEKQTGKYLCTKFKEVVVPPGPYFSIRVIVTDGASNVSATRGTKSSMSKLLITDIWYDAEHNVLYIWCLAHRSNLAWGDAMLELPADMVRLIAALPSHLRASSLRQTKFEAVIGKTKELEELTGELMETAAVLGRYGKKLQILRYHAGRWVSFIKVVTRVDDLFTPTLLYVGDSAQIVDLDKKITKAKISKARPPPIVDVPVPALVAVPAPAVVAVPAQVVAVPAPVALAVPAPIEVPAPPVIDDDHLLNIAVEPPVVLAPDDQWSPVNKLRRSSRASSKHPVPLSLLSRAVRNRIQSELKNDDEGRSDDSDDYSSDSENERDHGEGSDGEESDNDSRQLDGQSQPPWVTQRARIGENKQFKRALKLGQHVERAKRTISVERMPGLLRDFRGLLIFISEVGHYYEVMICIMQTTSQPWIHRAYDIMQTTLLSIARICLEPKPPAARKRKAAAPVPPPAKPPSLEELLVLVYTSNAKPPEEQMAILATHLYKLINPNPNSFPEKESDAMEVDDSERCFRESCHDKPTVVCMSCDAAFCASCFAEVHQKGRRQRHVSQPLSQPQPAASRPAQPRVVPAGVFGGRVHDVFFFDRWQRQQRPTFAALPRFSQWLQDPENLGPVADRTKAVAVNFVSTFVRSFCSRALKDISFFLACRLFDPQHRAEFAENPDVVIMHLARIQQEFPDLVSASVFHSAQMYFAKDSLGSIRLPDPPVSGRSSKENTKSPISAKEGKKSKKANKAANRTLTDFYADVKAIFPAECGDFATLALSITSIIPTSVICEQRFSLVKDVLTAKRQLLSLSKVNTYGYFRDFTKYKSFIEMNGVMKEFGHVLPQIQ